MGSGEAGGAYARQLRCGRGSCQKPWPEVRTVIIIIAVWEEQKTVTLKLMDCPLALFFFKLENGYIYFLFVRFSMALSFLSLSVHMRGRVSSASSGVHRWRRADEPGGSVVRGS